MNKVDPLVLVTGYILLPIINHHIFWFQSHTEWHCLKSIYVAGTTRRHSRLFNVFNNINSLNNLHWRIIPETPHSRRSSSNSSPLVFRAKHRWSKDELPCNSHRKLTLRFLKWRDGTHHDDACVSWPNKHPGKWKAYVFHSKLHN